MRTSGMEGMMARRCPFCWSGNVRPRGPAGGSRTLAACGDCEKWFWDATGEEVPRLYALCATALTRPGRCDATIREALNSGGNGFPRRRAAEFNRVCSGCLHARFLSRGTAARV